MALPSDYISGTITLINGSTAFTGTGTGWLAADFREGDIILDVEGGEGAVAVIASITSNTAGVLSKEWEGPTLTGVAYRMRYQWDSGRVSAQSRAAIEMLGNGNLQSFASITGPGVPVFDGPHSVTIKPESEFVNGVAYDVQVDTLADRAAYDGQSEGFAVLVSDMGDGRSALFSKASNTSGDWTDPAYVTGSVGPMPDVEATVDTLPPGSTASVTPTPITGGVRLDFELPEASGFYNAGVYDIPEAYNQDDVVRFNGSSFIALQSVPAGTSPSSAFPPVDTAYWQVLAAKGADGTGTGDVVGPSGAVTDRIAVFDGTTGKVIKDGGVTIAELQPEGAVRYDESQSLSQSEQGVARNNIGLKWPVPPGHRYGMILSNNGSNSIDISPGERASDASTPILLKTTTTFTKDLNSAWSAGASGGFLDTGTKASNTAYAVFAIGGESVPDDFIATATYATPTLPTGYTHKRYLGTICTATNIFAFTQVGNYFRRATPTIIIDVADITTSSVTRTLPYTPRGVSVKLDLSLRLFSAAAVPAVYLRHPSDADLVPSFSVAPLASLSANVNVSAIGQAAVWQNTSGQIATRGTVSGGGAIVLVAALNGWEDPNL